MKTILSISLLLIFTLIATSGAQTLPPNRCVNDETIGDCFDRLDPSKFVPAEAMKQTQAAAANEAVGLLNVSGPGTPALIDFLNLFAGSVSDATFNQADAQYTFEWNIPVGIISEDDKIKLQSVFNRKPQLDQALQKAIPNSAALASSLSDLDDITINAAYAPIGRTMGRTIYPHRALVQELLSRVLTKLSDDAQVRKNAFLRQHQNEPPFQGVSDADKIRFSSIVDLNLRGTLKDLVAAAALGEVANMTVLRGGFRELGINRLYELVGNQPQFYVNITDHQRKNLVGPDEVSGKLTYEWGNTNLNRFLQQAGAACANEGDPACGTKFIEYVDSHAAAADTAERFSLSVEFAHVGRNDIVLAAPNPVVNLHADGSHKFTGTVAYGRVLRRTDNHRDTRLDVSGSYENFSNDPKKKDRGVLSVIVTTKISDSMSLPFGIAYANHGTYLTDVDKKLNVHFGLVYRMKSNP